MFASTTTAWAVLNHSSDYALVVPEPSTAILMGLGLGLTLFGFRPGSVGVNSFIADFAQRYLEGALAAEAIASTDTTVQPGVVVHFQVFRKCFGGRGSTATNSSEWKPSDAPQMPHSGMRAKLKEFLHAVNTKSSRPPEQSH